MTPTTQASAPSRYQQLPGTADEAGLKLRATAAGPGGASQPRWPSGRAPGFSLHW